MRVIEKLPETLVIDRAKWMRGKGTELSRLLVADGDDAGQMCCLGQCALACGLSEADIRGVGAPVSLLNKNIARIGPLVNAECVDNTEATYHLMMTNDNMNLTEPEREAKLTTLFATLGTTVTFIN